MPLCKYCEKSFNRARDTKKFCSDKCRVYWNRKNSVTNKTVSVTPIPKISPKQEKDSVTSSEEIIYDERESHTRAEDWNPEKDF